MKGMPLILSRRFARVWQRNLVVYRRIWKISFVPPLLEPLFYIAAFGFGMSSLVGSIRFEGADISYVQFIAPALVSISIMYNSFFETTYASFVRMYYQKTYDAMMATPLSLEDIMTGEIVWAATKSVVATVVMGAVISLFGLVSYPEGLLILAVAFVGGFAFGCIGLFFTGITRTIETFNLPVFLFVTPMFLFSGTFFPLDNLPRWAQLAAFVFPLTHVVIPVRSLCAGLIRIELLWNVGYLLFFSCVFFPLALLKMRRRLVQ